MNQPLEGYRVLVVEDDRVMGLVIEDMLKELGVKDVKTTTSFEVGLNHARDADINVAILDIKLSPQATSYPIAQALMRRDIPFVFVTGFDLQGHAADWQKRPTLSKPFRTDDLAAAIKKATQAQSSARRDASS